MANLQNNLNKSIAELIQSAKLEYESDTSWVYRNETPSISISFSQDETGKNHIDEFNHKHNGLWIELIPSDEQVKMMFDKLNETPYREVEEEFSEAIHDHYDYYGVNRNHFY